VGEVDEGGGQKGWVGEGGVVGGGGGRSDGGEVGVWSVRCGGA